MRQDRRRLRQAQPLCLRGRAGAILPHLGAGQFQAATPLRLRRRDSQIAGRQAAAATARRRRIRGRAPAAIGRRLIIKHQQKEAQMPSPYTFSDPRLAKLDGFKVEIDEAHERADIILGRPPYNIVAMPQRDQLRLTFETLDEDPRVRIIVLRGEREHVSKLAWNIAAPARCAKPVIVANRGYCFGVGFELSLACDFRIASETTQYALPEQKLGQIPGSGGSARLQKMVGITRTKDIVMRSKRISAKQALEWGIATECVPDAELEKATDKLVDELRTFSPLAQRTAKKLLNDTEDSTLAIAIELEGHCYSRLRQSADFKEGVEAFNAKRAAKFTGL